MKKLRLRGVYVQDCRTDDQKLYEPSLRLCSVDNKKRKPHLLILRMCQVLCWARGLYCLPLILANITKVLVTLFVVEKIEGQRRS